MIQAYQLIVGVTNFLYFILFSCYDGDDDVNKFSSIESGKVVEEKVKNFFPLKKMLNKQMKKKKEKEERRMLACVIHIVYAVFLKKLVIID